MTTSIQGRQLVSVEAFNAQRETLVSVKTTLAAGANYDYDIAAVLKARFDAEHASDLTPPAFDITLWNLQATQIQVYVMDNDAGSPTVGYWVDASAVCGVGFKEDGKVRVANQFTIAMDLMIRVTVIRKPFAVA